MDANLTSRPTKDLPPALEKRPALTPWFPASLKPARIGLYRVKWRRLGEGPAEWCWWNGSRWAWSYGTTKDALSDKETEGAHQHKLWRGLASNPARSKA